MAWYALALLVLLVGGATLTSRILRRALGRIAVQSDRMRQFDFAAAPERSAFRDVDAVLSGLERAKTAMRALGKYAPVDLVRELYEQNREPTLGGELRTLSILFTDIKDFTTVSEQLAPAELARHLGDYFEAMTAAVIKEGGTLDKYVGDSLMVLWNAPNRQSDHALRACRAALACIEAERTLCASQLWNGLAPWTTRFGIHCDEVMLGHFGAPDRMSYTAIGDGVNLASRLEALNKQYGTTAIVSQSIVDQVGSAMAVRRLDRVAVKGKSNSVMIYELLSMPVDDRARTYEAALDAYFARDFAGAIALLAAQLDDRPSQLLVERAHKLVATPPPADWNGVYIWSTK
jgi:adenylate cyclase